MLPRSQLELRLAQARQFGFSEFETWGEAAPGEPFYLFGQHGELRLDLGIADEVDGALLVKVHRLSFDVGGREAPAGYQVHLPPDTFAHPPVEIDGVVIRAASPLCLYQMRVGIASRGSFGELSERQRESLRRLRETFFPDRSEAAARAAASSRWASAATEALSGRTQGSSFSITTEAFTLCAVPPIKIARVTPAADEWLLSVRTSPAPRVRIACPVFSWVPAPEPYTVPGASTPLTNIAI